MQLPQRLLRVLPRRDAPAPARGQAARGRTARRAPQRANPTAYQGIREVGNELRKVTWPTRENAFNLTGVVVIVSAAVGLLLGGADVLFNWIINEILLKLGT